MKRLLPYAAFVAGLLVIMVLLPRFNAAQPRGIRLTRGDAVSIADAEARRFGIPVDRAWTVLSWTTSPLLEKELEGRPELRRRASDDPVLGPRLVGYKRPYYRRGREKWQPYGHVVVDARTGQILMTRRRLRDEESGVKPTEPQLGPRADLLFAPAFFPALPPRGSSPRGQRLCVPEPIGRFATGSIPIFRSAMWCRI